MRLFSKSVLGHTLLLCPVSGVDGKKSVWFCALYLVRALGRTQLKPYHVHAVPEGDRRKLRTSSNNQPAWFFSRPGVIALLECFERRSVLGETEYQTLKQLRSFFINTTEEQMYSAWVSVPESGDSAVTVQERQLPLPVPRAEAEPEPIPASVNTEANLAGANQTFAFRGQNVRTVIKDGEPWFVARDVCDALGLRNVTRTLDRLEEDEKGFTKSNTPSGPQKYSIISESGLSAVVLKSRKPEAKPFYNWVMSEVLPALRKKSEPEPVRAEPAPEPAPEPVSEPVELKSVNTGANLAGLNVTPDAMARKMSSREIAELTGKRHDHVLRDIRDLIKQGAIGLPKVGESSYTNSQNKEQPEYLLDFDATMTLVTGYNAVLRAKVVKRWRELETSTAVKQAPEPAPCKTWGKDNLPTAAVVDEFEAWKKVAVSCGLDNNAACFSANGVLARNYGIAPLQIAQISLPAPDNEQCLTPTEIADILAKSGLCKSGQKGAFEVNCALAQLKLQYRKPDGSGWIPTDAGKEAGARIFDTGKLYNNGGMVQQVKWGTAIISQLSDYFREQRSLEAYEDRVWTR